MKSLPTSKRHLSPISSHHARMGISSQAYLSKQRLRLLNDLSPCHSLCSRTYKTTGHLLASHTNPSPPRPAFTDAELKEIKRKRRGDDPDDAYVHLQRSQLVQMWNADGSEEWGDEEWEQRDAARDCMIEMRRYAGLPDSVFHSEDKVGEKRKRKRQGLIDRGNQIREKPVMFKESIDVVNGGGDGVDDELEEGEIDPQVDSLNRIQMRIDGLHRILAVESQRDLEMANLIENQINTENERLWLMEQLLEEKHALREKESPRGHRLSQNEGSPVTHERQHDLEEQDKGYEGFNTLETKHDAALADRRTPISGQDPVCAPLPQPSFVLPLSPPSSPSNSDSDDVQKAYRNGDGDDSDMVVEVDELDVGNLADFKILPARPGNIQGLKDPKFDKQDMSAVDTDKSLTDDGNCRSQAADAKMLEQLAARSLGVLQGAEG